MQLYHRVARGPCTSRLTRPARRRPASDPNDVLGVLGTDGKTDRGGRDVLLGELLGRELGVRGGSRVHDERLDIGHVGEQREHLQMIDELPSCLLATLNLKGKDRAPPLGKYF